MAANAHNVQAIANVLIEEIGHFIDAQINTVDSAGDGGEIFAKLVKGESISQQELAVLKAEDDTKTITLNGELISIEQNDPLVVTNNSDDTLGSLRDLIDQAKKNPGVDNIYLTDVSGIINLHGSLTVDSDINFIDDGDTTISGQSQWQIFNITNGANVVFSKLTLASGYAKGRDAKGGGGGGLGFGGALLISSGNVTIRDVIFYNNQAIGGSSSGNAGSGGIGGNYKRDGHF